MAEDAKNISLSQVTQNEVQEDVRYAELDNRIIQAEKRLEKIEKEFDKKTNELNQLKVQIFAIMGLFFAIFTFISIDFSITKDLIEALNTTWIKEAKISFLLYVVAMLATLASVQIVFFHYVKNLVLSIIEKFNTLV